MNKRSMPTGKIGHQLRILLKGDAPSTMDMVQTCNMTRPGSGIHHLRKYYEVPIETEIVKQKNSKGETTWFARYRIPPSRLQEQRERFGF